MGDMTFTPDIVSLEESLEEKQRIFHHQEGGRIKRKEVKKAKHFSKNFDLNLYPSQGDIHKL